jgi:hypothetical protein
MRPSLEAGGHGGECRLKQAGVRRWWLQQSGWSFMKDERVITQVGICNSSWYMPFKGKLPVSCSDDVDIKVQEMRRVDRTPAPPTMPRV